MADESTGRRSLDEVRELQKQVGTWGRDDFHDLRDAVQATVLRCAQIDGKIDLITQKLEASGEQRDRVERKTDQIETHLREQNGRLRKAEGGLKDTAKDISRLEKVVYGAVGIILASVVIVLLAGIGLKP